QADADAELDADDLAPVLEDGEERRPRRRHARTVEEVGRDEERDAEADAVGERAAERQAKGAADLDRHRVVDGAVDPRERERAEDAADREAPTGHLGEAGP